MLSFIYVWAYIYTCIWVTYYCELLWNAGKNLAAWLLVGNMLRLVKKPKADLFINGELKSLRGSCSFDLIVLIVLLISSKLWWSLSQRCPVNQNKHGNSTASWNWSKMRLDKRYNLKDSNVFWKSALNCMKPAKARTSGVTYGWDSVLKEAK